MRRGGGRAIVGPVKLRTSAFGFVAALSLATLALADDAPVMTTHPSPAASGVAVLGVGDSADATWPLAQAVYGSDALRPAAIDEAHARVLAGESPDPSAAGEVKELAELRQAVHGDDAASQALLKNIAERVHVRSVLVLFVSADAAPSARLFTADGGFDAAIYQPDDGAGAVRGWSGTVRSLSRSLTGAIPITNFSTSVVASATPVAPAVAPRSEPKPVSKAFYLSPWFWGAIGAAAFGGLAVFLVTRDTSDGQIHLQMQVPP